MVIKTNISQTKTMIKLSKIQWNRTMDILQKFDQNQIWLFLMIIMALSVVQQSFFPGQTTTHETVPNLLHARLVVGGLWQ